MVMNKRAFLKNVGLLSLSSLPLWDVLAKANERTATLSAEAVAGNEDFWATVRGGYKLKPDYINLENGYYCFQPQEILEHYINHIREVNYQASYYMRTVQWENKRKVAAKLAALAGCSPEELIITRNTTESLDMIIGGIRWKAGG